MTIQRIKAASAHAVSIPLSALMVGLHGASQLGMYQRTRKALVRFLKASDGSLFSVHAPAF